MPIVQAVQQPDYGRIIRDALGVYQNVSQMEQEESEREKIKRIEQLSKDVYEDPAAWKELKSLSPERATQLEQMGNVKLDRFFKYRAHTALEIKDLPPQRQAEVLAQKAAELRAEGRDPTQTLEIRQRILSGDKSVNDELKAYVEQGYQTGYLERPKKEKGAYKIATEQEKIRAGIDPKKAFQISPEGKFVSLDTKGQTINIGGDADNKVFKGELAKDQVAHLRQVSDKANIAEGQNQTLTEMKNIDVQQGAFEPMKMQLGAFGESLGIDMSSLANVPAGQAYNAKSKALVLAEMQKQKRPQTENDMKMIRSTVAGLGQTPEANKFLIDAAIAQNKRAIEERDFLNNWLQEKGNLNGAEAEWNKYKQKVPMVASNLKQNGLPMFYNQFEELAREQDPTASREDIIAEWNRLDKEAKKSSVPMKKAVESAKPIPVMMNSRVPSSYSSDIPEKPAMTPIRDTSGGRYGL